METGQPPADAINQSDLDWLVARLGHYREQLSKIQVLMEEWQILCLLDISAGGINVTRLAYILNAHAVETIEKDHDIQWEDVVNVANAVLKEPVFEVTQKRWYDAGCLFLRLSYVRAMCEMKFPKLEAGTPKEILKDHCPARLEADMNVYHPVSSAKYLLFGWVILQQYFQKESEVLPHTYQMAAIEKETLEKIAGDPEACKSELRKLADEVGGLNQKMRSELVPIELELHMAKSQESLD
ncbi:hypothetical protein VFPPC_13094 [Pochonia chlamydosporia 170]|uniref:Uncharacterized protein n=1 Tax=Pochonia chlamydosporia 170 TaxID=1380566 RepID=A0A179G9N2_METCM|nr:hypothetical protein VFPPC_13094 [Pochonia chlamydosporia 170]OAQ73859.1 hypothetical protein VFPPC_13094 [Pochonia chlamydosporia 170]